MDLDFSIISRQITAIQIGKTGYVFVLYKDGTTLIHKNNDLIGKNLTGKLDFLKQMLELKNGLLNYDFKGDKFSVVRTLDEYGWTLGGGTYYAEIKQPLNALRNFIMISCALTLIAVLAGIFLMTRSITTPLANINANMKDIAEGEGDLTRRLEMMSKDEIGNLAQSFNTFIDKLRVIITGNRKKTPSPWKTWERISPCRSSDARCRPFFGPAAGNPRERPVSFLSKAPLTALGADYSNTPYDVPLPIPNMPFIVVFWSSGTIRAQSPFDSPP